MGRLGNQPPRLDRQERQRWQNIPCTARPRVSQRANARRRLGRILQEAQKLPLGIASSYDNSCVTPSFWARWASSSIRETLRAMGSSLEDYCQWTKTLQ